MSQIPVLIGRESFRVLAWRKSIPGPGSVLRTRYDTVLYSLADAWLVGSFVLCCDLALDARRGVLESGGLLPLPGTFREFRPQED